MKPKIPNHEDPQEALDWFKLVALAAQEDEEHSPDELSGLDAACYRTLQKAITTKEVYVLFTHREINARYSTDEPTGFAVRTKELAEEWCTKNSKACPSYKKITILESLDD